LLLAQTQTNNHRSAMPKTAAYPTSETPRPKVLVSRLGAHVHVGGRG